METTKAAAVHDIVTINMVLVKRPSKVFLLMVWVGCCLGGCFEDGSFFDCETENIYELLHQASIVDGLSLAL